MASSGPPLCASDAGAAPSIGPSSGGAEGSRDGGVLRQVGIPHRAVLHDVLVAPVVEHLAGGHHDDAVAELLDHLQRMLHDHDRDTRVANAPAGLADAANE